MPVIEYPELFYTNFHPGIDVFHGWKLNQSMKNRLYVTANTSFYYHQFVQSLLKIYSNLHYEKMSEDKLSLEASIGAGLGIDFEGSNAFELNDNGQYEKNHSFGLVLKNVFIDHIVFRLSHNVDYGINFFLGDYLTFVFHFFQKKLGNAGLDIGYDLIASLCACERAFYGFQVSP